MLKDHIELCLNQSANYPPPGCVSTYVDTPGLSDYPRDSIEVGYMMQHRFAFWYWAKWKAKGMMECDYKIGTKDETRYCPPDLVTWDWHNDFGADADVSVEVLSSLDIKDEKMVALFAWSSLSSLNDGHILPAVKLNLIANVFLLLPEGSIATTEKRNMYDLFGNKHSIYWVDSADELFERRRSNCNDVGLYWDLDMDFFTGIPGSKDEVWAVKPSLDRIDGLLNPEEPLMDFILREVRGITIALEPRHTGGLTRSLEVYQRWEQNLFTGKLFSDKCYWKY